MNLVFKEFTLKENQSSTYSLVPLELKEYIDFEVKRIYYLSGFSGGATGQHSHIIEKELFVIIQGQCTAVIDQGNGREDIPLISGKAIYAGNLVWHGFKDISEDCIILALSSTNYIPDRSDYIEDYERYLQIRSEKLQNSNS